MDEKLKSRYYYTCHLGGKIMEYDYWPKYSKCKSYRRILYIYIHKIVIFCGIHVSENGVTIKLHTNIQFHGIYYICLY